jgi:hypothetical protein
MKKLLKFNNNEYLINFDEISVQKAIVIDQNSYVDGAFSSFAEAEAIFKYVDLSIQKNNSYITIENLTFKEGMLIYNSVAEELSINGQEENRIIKQCENSFKKVNELSFDFLLAKNIFNGSVVMGINDFKNMNIREYESVIVHVETMKKLTS